MRDYIQKNDFGQNFVFFVPHRPIPIRKHSVIVRVKDEHHVDLLSGVIRFLTWEKKRL